MRVAIATLIVASISAVAEAQADAPVVAQARELFEQAEEHYEGGRYALAAQAFQRSHELLVEAGHPNAYLVLFNVGRSLEELGRDAEARDAYASFLERGPLTEETAPMVRLAQEHIRELDARLESDGEGEALRPDHATSISPIGPVVLAAGGVLIVAGTIVGAIALAADSSLMSACGADMLCPESERSAVETLGQLALTTDILLFGGLAMASAGALLTALLRESSEQVGDVGLHFAPMISAAGCALTIRGGF